jgi:predicted transcriptional regulator
MKFHPIAESPRSAGTVSVKLDPTDRERIAVLASTKKRTAHYLMKEAIHEYIQREESRLNFIRAAEAASQEFKDTGMHVTHDELDSWMETWGTENEQPMPVCHT